MMQFIRQHLTGWIAWGILGLVAIALVSTMGVSSYFDGGQTQAAARVNGEDISQQTFQRVFEQQKQNLRQQLGDQYDPSLVDEPGMKKRILDQLVNESLLAQFVEDGNFRVSDEELKKQIKTLEIFQKDGAFSKELYDQFLRNRGFAEAEFRNMFRRNLVITQLQEGLQLSGFATPQEIDSAAALQGQERTISYIRVPVDKYKASVEVKDDEIQKFYQENASRFMTAEKVKLDYLELSAEKLSEGVNVDEAKLKELYDIKLKNNELGAPEERRASHILVRLAEGADDATAKTAKEKVEGLLTQIKAGGDFAELAKKNSDDPGSAQQGGDLGFFQKGVMHAEFEKAAYALAKEGDLSEIVKTPFGYHIIKLTGVKAARTKTFDEARPDLEREEKLAQAETIFAEKSDKLQELVFVNPDTLDIAAKELGLTVQQSDWVERGGGTGVFGNPEVIKAAFSDAVQKESKNSDPIKISNNATVVVRQKAHEAPKQRPLDEVKQEIVDRLKYTKALDQVKQTGTQLVADLKAGKEAGELAKAKSLEVKEAGAIKRDASGEDHEIVSKAFLMPKPESGKTSVDGFSVVSGDYVALILKSVKNGSQASLKEEEKQGLQRRLAFGDGNAAMGNLLKHLNRTASISKNEEGPVAP